MTYVPPEIRSLIYSFGVIPQSPSDEQVDYMIDYITNRSKYRCNISLQSKYNEIPRSDLLRILEKYDPPVSMSYETKESIRRDVSINTFDRDRELIDRLSPLDYNNYCILPDNGTTRSDPLIRDRIADEQQGYLIVALTDKAEYIPDWTISSYINLRRSSPLIEYINSVKRPIRYIYSSIMDQSHVASTSEELRSLQPNIISKIYQQVRIRSDLIEALQSFQDRSVHGFKINGRLSELIWTEEEILEDINECHTLITKIKPGRTNEINMMTMGDIGMHLLFKAIGYRYCISFSGPITQSIQYLINTHTRGEDCDNHVSISAELDDPSDSDPMIWYNVIIRTTDQSMIDTVEAYIYCTSIMPVVFPD
uniref:Uncharacterized protein n=1 Tax=viral metagenome TaxID=1070528 RepID=A0A6C0BKV5_9ZZZZ